MMVRLLCIWLLDNGKLDCVKALIEAGADLNAKENDGWTALHLAACNGKLDCVKALIEAGADLNAKDNDGWTALHLAARYGKLDCVKALIEAGADLNAKRMMVRLLCIWLLVMENLTV